MRKHLISLAFIYAASFILAQAQPYPASKVFTSLTWASVGSITTAAAGSDGWAMSWADDDNIYSVYGDGFGWEPLLGSKLGLGFVSITGTGASYSGTNIHPSDGEQIGDGRSSKKGSGMLYVNGKLYMMVRNADGTGGGTQCQLAWSTNYGVNWTFASWKFTNLGYCALINYGKNYALNSDGYVYMYSPNNNSAYNEANSALLLRVLKGSIETQGAWQYFSGLDSAGDPTWSSSSASASSVFNFTGGVNRIDATIHPNTGRVLLVTRSRAMAGGLDQFSIYEAPFPWGPWATVYYVTGALNGGWDTDPGESAHIPSKWIASDGNSFYLAFSGGDQFSVRQGTLTVVTTYYVDGTCSTSGDGTTQTCGANGPKKTIAEGVTLLSAGTTLNIKAGTYSENGIVFSKNGDSSRPVLLRNFGTDLVILDGVGRTPTSTFASAILVYRSSYVTLDGLQIKNWSSSTRGFGIYQSDNIKLTNCKGINNGHGEAAIQETNTFTVSDCEFSGSLFHGIWVENADNGTLDRIISHDNTATPSNPNPEDDGIHIGNSRDIIIQNSVTYGNYEQGFDIGGHNNPSSQRITLRNCVAHDNGTGPVVGGFKVGGYQDDTVLIDNSIAYSNGWGGFTLLGGKDVTLTHSTSWNNGNGHRVSNCSGQPTGAGACVIGWQTNTIIRDMVGYDNTDALTVDSSNTSITMDYNGYSEILGPDPDAIGYKTSGSWSLANFGTYKTVTGQDAHSLVANPLLVNTADPDGPDNIFFTADDGLLLSGSSPFLISASDGGQLGYRVGFTPPFVPTPPPSTVDGRISITGQVTVH